MKVLILGGDGYLGWPTAMYLSQRGHQVSVVDNMIKRYWEAEFGVEPLTPIRPLPTRVKKWKETSGKDIQVVRKLKQVQGFFTLKQDREILQRVRRTSQIPA